MIFALNFIKKKIGLGKRKQAIARVFFEAGNGNLIINKMVGEKYLQYNLHYLDKIWIPLKQLKLEKQFNIKVIVTGGGLSGQTEAIQLGVSRLLCQINVHNRSILKPLKFLKRDARTKERKKYGLRKARKAPQYSKR